MMWWGCSRYRLTVSGLIVEIRYLFDESFCVWTFTELAYLRDEPLRILTISKLANLVDYDKLLLPALPTVV